jgi:hypothetical protein
MYTAVSVSLNPAHLNMPRATAPLHMIIKACIHFHLQAIDELQFAAWTNKHLWHTHNTTATAAHEYKLCSCC